MSYSMETLAKLQEWLTTLMVTVLIGFAMIFIGTVIWNAGIRGSEGKIDYCYVSRVEYQNSVAAFQLKGHVPWRNDVTVGVFDSLPNAVEAARRFSCPVDVK